MSRADRFLLNSALLERPRDFNWFGDDLVRVERRRRLIDRYRDREFPTLGNAVPHELIVGDQTTHLTLEEHRVGNSLAALESFGIVEVPIVALRKHRRSQH